MAAGHVQAQCRRSVDAGAVQVQVLCTWAPGRRMPWRTIAALSPNSTSKMARPTMRKRLACLPLSCGPSTRR